MHLMQLAVFVLYSIHIKSEQWLPFFKIVMNKKCNPLWMWSEDELKDLQDEELIKTVIVWKEVVSQLAANIAPKLNSFGLFAGSDIEPDTLVRYMASHHIISQVSMYLANNIGDTMLADSMVLAYAYALEGEEGYSTKFYTGRVCPEVPLPFYIPFFHKRYSFRILFIDKLMVPLSHT